MSASHDLSRRLSTLAHPERRRILVELAGTTDSVAVPIEREDPVSKPVDPEIRLDVLHYHVPELEADEYVRFDEEEAVVTRGPRFADIRPFLDVSNGHRFDNPL